MTGRTLLYYRYDRMGGDRWFRGDRHLRRPIRRLVRGPDPVGGIDLVFLNLCAGLDRLGVPYEANLPFKQIRPGDHVGVIGRGREALEGYEAQNPILAGVAVAEHPRAWPTLFEDYPVSRYVVHCDWVKAMYERVYGPRIVTWPVGIDTDAWAPSGGGKATDFLIYDKVRWDPQKVCRALVDPIRNELDRRGICHETIRYGAYKPHELMAALSRCRALLFLCEHETQGLAYQQAMSAGLPVLAWDPGQWLDPMRFAYGEVSTPATSVPFFDARCGTTFASAVDFPAALTRFMDERARYDPRAYILETLTLERCAKAYLDLLNAHA